jgi:hypothetical protein
MLPAAHSIGQSLVHEVALKLPEPTAKVTIPIIIVFALLALLAMVRKLIALALIAIIIVAGFAAYQSGAFDHWVDKGKQIVNEHK